jgi:hypothetical protein
MAFTYKKGSYTGGEEVKTKYNDEMFWPRLCICRKINMLAILKNYGESILFKEIISTCFALNQKINILHNVFKQILYDSSKISFFFTYFYFIFSISCLENFFILMDFIFSINSLESYFLKIFLILNNHTIQLINNCNSSHYY